MGHGNLVRLVGIGLVLLKRNFSFCCEVELALDKNVIETMNIATILKYGSLVSESTIVKNDI